MTPLPPRDSQDMDTRLRLLEVSEALHTRRLDDHESAMRELSGAVDKVDTRLAALVERLGSIEKKLVAIGVVLAVALGGNDALTAAAKSLG